MIDFAHPEIGAVVQLPELAGKLGHEQPEFCIDRAFQGGMGVCLKLKHVQSGTAVGLKAIKPEHVGDQDAWGRFMEELKVWFTVSACDGIAEALCIVRVNEIPCMCATWMEMGSLRPHLRTATIDFAFRTLTRIIGALDWAYTKHGIIHRDLKPENILLDDHANAYVSDWGLARPVEKILVEVQKALPTVKFARPEFTQAGQFLGTVLYAAPEQILGLPKIDNRADIYSLGCLMYELESDSPPFTGPTVATIAHQHLHVAAPKLGGLFRSTKLGLEKVIARCLEKNPKLRYRAYRELAAEVLSAAKRKGVKIVPYQAAERYYRPEIGKGEFTERFQKPELFNSQGYALMELKQLDAYLAEATSLMGLGQYAQAAKILGAFYIPGLCQDKDNWHLGHGFALNYALCLSASARDQSEAIAVFQDLVEHRSKPVEFYINYSLALIRNEEYQLAEHVATRGLNCFPHDTELLGNLGIALRHQRKFSAALPIAEKRLSFGRNLHTLEEVAGLLQDLGDECRWTDWASATGYFKSAISLIREAIQLNPRHWALHYTHAQLLQRLFNFTPACEACQTVFQNADRRELGEAAICLLAEILYDAKDYEPCESFTKKWIELIKFDHLTTWLKRTRARALADGYMIGNKHDGNRVVIPEVVEFFESQASSSMTVNTDDLIFLARAYEWIGRSDEAHEILDSRLSGHHYWKISWCRAQFLCRQNRLTEAIEAAKQSVRLAPDCPDPLDMLAFIYSQAGDNERAAYTKQKAQAVYERQSALAKLE
jgi:tetratricopeptide (TPR) repeat protein